MEDRICLDTDVAIEVLRKSEKVKFLKEKYFDTEICLTTITVFELLLRKTNLHEVEDFIMDSTVLSFDDLSARKASYISKELDKVGKTTQLKDLFLAAVCLTNNCKLATFNKKHFENIKELELV